MSTPPGVVEPTRSSVLAHWLLGAAADELAATVGGPVAVTMLAPGAGPPPADYCCVTDAGHGGHGAAWVRIARRYPSASFPIPDARPNRCATGWAAELEIGVYRCAHTSDDAGNPPAPEEITSDALMVDADAHALLRACCRLKWPYVLGGWNQMGPAGGCVGSVQHLTVALASGPIGRE